MDSEHAEGEHAEGEHTGREHPGRAKSLRIGIAVVAAGASVAATGYVGQALASPQPTMAQVKAQVNDLQAKADRTGQQYDQATEQLARARAQLSGARQDAARAQAQFTETRAKLARLMAASFEDGNQSSAAAVVAGGDPTTVLRQASLLQEVASNRTMQISVFLANARDLAAAREKRQRTEQGIESLQSQLAAKQKTLDGLLASREAVLSKLTAQQRAEVAAASVGGSGTAATPSPAASPVASPSPAASTAPGTSTSPSGPATAGETAAAFAKAQIGKPYAWGATGPGSYDCSGLVQAAWAAAGVSIPRTTYDQWSALPHVSRSSLQPGDLLFFEGEGHVSIYIGNGEMIDAPRTGEVIRELSIDTDWYVTNYDGAVRP